MDDLEKELKISFLEEAIQLLDDTEQAFLDLETQPDNPSLVDKIFRLAHNIKGTSRAVGFGDVAEFTHELENLLLAMKEEKIKADGDIVTLLLKCNDHLRNLIEALNEDMDATFDSAKIIQQIKNMMLSKENTAIKSPQPEVEASLFEAPSDDVEGEGISADAINALNEFDEGDKDLADGILTEIQQAKEQRDENYNQSQLLQEVLEEAKSTEPEESAGATKKRQIEETIRVKLKELEKLNNYVGELVILQTVLTQNSKLIQSEFIQKTISQLEKLSKEIQTISMGLRMVPIKQNFQKMQRVVRDTSRALGKKVKLEIHGEMTEVDKTVLEHLGDPLVHIIRNAVDHGLEATPEDRKVAGKSEVGTVILRAYHEGNHLVIEVKDDGRGIHPEVIRERAIDKGIITKNQLLSDDELVNLVFHPGFSTKQEVSEISGRGVGMDVVKTNIQSLNGDVRVSTKVGKGSVFRIVLPLTLAIIDGLLVQVGKGTYVLPITQIHETLRPKKANITHVTGMGNMLTLRGEVMPVFKLGDALGVNHQLNDVWDGIVVIVRRNGQSFAVFVDEIMRLQQVVIKNLGSEIKKRKGMIGSAILGDGMPSIIIDLNEMFSSERVTTARSKFGKSIGAA